MEGMGEDFGDGHSGGVGWRLGSSGRVFTNLNGFPHIVFSSFLFRQFVSWFLVSFVTPPLPSRLLQTQSMFLVTPLNNYICQNVGEHQKLHGKGWNTKLCLTGGRTWVISLVIISSAENKPSVRDLWNTIINTKLHDGITKTWNQWLKNNHCVVI